MTSDKMDRAHLVKQYLAYAEQARASAKKTADPELRWHFEELAEGWQHLAEAISQDSS